MCILSITYWLLATFVFFKESNLVYWCLRDISFSSNLSRFLATPNLLIKFYQLNSPFALQCSKMVTLIATFSAYFLQNFRMIQLIVSSIFFFLCPKYIPRIICLHTFDLSYQSSILFQLYRLLVTTLALNGLSTRFWSATLVVPSHSRIFLGRILYT